MKSEEPDAGRGARRYRLAVAREGDGPFRAVARKGRGGQASGPSIRRGAMKYSQVRAMKYIAGIRVNSTA